VLARVYTCLPGFKVAPSSLLPPIFDELTAIDRHYDPDYSITTTYYTALTRLVAHDAGEAATCAAGRRQRRRAEVASVALGRDQRCYTV